MRKRDILTPIGITVGFIMIMLAILSSGGSEGLASFLDIPSIFIVIGGVIGSMMITFKLEQIKLAGNIFKQAFHKHEQELYGLVRLFIQLSDRARREGILSLESEITEIEDKFIRKGFLLAVDGVEPEVIKDIMEAEITAMEDRHYKGRVLFEKAGEYAPAWGMIGTLIGLVLMLNDLDDASALGPSMAVALLTTLYGTVLANLFFLPMSSKLEAKTEEEVFIKQIIIEGIIGVQSGQNPRILEEKLSAFLPKRTLVKQKDPKDDSAFVGNGINEA
ncbi:flagellar motor protein MotP [Oceanobacillus sp. 143]|uniref:Motility protein A n=1 Tax=Oceanobacillus zhaokaii TaxID=2052660 RepID=A0A345PI99_9BACI|nr:flagellar motor protein MotP [Oceanobacillus zhaokaii]AXI09729.1 motility protein A [Oceanobacillus zhaokaii]QGS69928.1 flagellar motor protein MotP [Oceanobacillus sp. 143]